MTRGADRAVSEIVGTVLMIAIVVAVVAVIVAVVVPRFQQLQDRGTFEEATATMTRLGERIVDLSRTDAPRTERVRLDVPEGRLDLLADRTCWVTTASTTGPERLNFTLSGIGDGDAGYGVEIHGSDGLGGGTDEPSDLVVEASRWIGNQRRVLADSPVLEVRPTDHVVFGGSETVGETAQVARYDAVEDETDQASASLPSARAEAAAVWAPDRRVAYVFGGTAGGDEIVAYAPHNDTAWVAGTLPQAVEDAAAVWAPDRDTAYVLGGDVGGSATDAIVAWTPANGTAWQVASLPSTRTDASAVWDPGRGHVYVLGGRPTVAGAELATITAFSPANGTAWDRSELPDVRADTGAAWDPGREVAYLFGGAGPRDTITAWDPATGQTTEPTALPAPRAAVSATWDAEQGLAYVFGGVGSLGNPTASIVAFDPASGSASTVSGTLPTARSATAAVAADPGNGSLDLADRDGEPVPLCSGRVRLRIVETGSGNVTGEAWVLSSGSARWQAPLQGGLHAVEVLHGARIVERPGQAPRLERFDAIHTTSSAVEISTVRVTVPDGVASTASPGPATVPIRGQGAFAMTDAPRGNVTVAFHGSYNATVRDHVLSGTTFRSTAGGPILKVGPVELVAVDRPVALVDGILAR